jgi:hypothetical protein
MSLPLGAIDETNTNYWLITSDQARLAKADNVIWVESVNELVSILNDKYPCDPDCTKVCRESDTTVRIDRLAYTGTDIDRLLDLAREHGSINCSKETKVELDRQRKMKQVFRGHWLIQDGYGQYGCQVTYKKDVIKQDIGPVWLEKSNARAAKKGELHFSVYCYLLDSFLVPSFNESVLSSLGSCRPNERHTGVRIDSFHAKTHAKEHMYSVPQDLSKAIIQITGRPMWRKRKDWKKMVEMLTISISKMKGPKTRGFKKWVQAEIVAANKK